MADAARLSLGACTCTGRSERQAWRGLVVRAVLRETQTLILDDHPPRVLAANVRELIRDATPVAPPSLSHSSHIGDASTRLRERFK
jgi:hypothetical protein